jgi:hypothetical protein
LIGTFCTPYITHFIYKRAGASVRKEGDIETQTYSQTQTHACSTSGNIRRSIKICTNQPLFLAAVAGEYTANTMYVPITLAALVALS